MSTTEPKIELESPSKPNSAATAAATADEKVPLAKSPLSTALEEANAIVDRFTKWTPSREAATSVGSMLFESTGPDRVVVSLLWHHVHSVASMGGDVLVLASSRVLERTWPPRGILDRDSGGCTPTALRSSIGSGRDHGLEPQWSAEALRRVGIRHVDDVEGLVRSLGSLHMIPSDRRPPSLLVLLGLEDLLGSESVLCSSAFEKESWLELAASRVCDVAVDSARLAWLEAGKRRWEETDRTSAKGRHVTKCDRSRAPFTFAGRRPPTASPPWTGCDVIITTSTASSEFAAAAQLIASAAKRSVTWHAKLRTATDFSWALSVSPASWTRTAALPPAPLWPPAPEPEPLFQPANNPPTLASAAGTYRAKVVTVSPSRHADPREFIIAVTERSTDEPHP